jgi:hypothetical protein
MEIGDPADKIAEVAEEIGADLVVVGHRPQGPLARWLFGSTGSYLVKRLRCSVLVGQTEITDEEFEQMKRMAEMPTVAPSIPSIEQGVPVAAGRPPRELTLRESPIPAAFGRP